MDFHGFAEFYVFHSILRGKSLFSMWLCDSGEAEIEAPASMSQLFPSRLLDVTIVSPLNYRRQR